MLLHRPLDALGHGGHPERVRQRDDGAHDRARLRVLGDLAQERAVDLQGLDRQRAQARERRPAGAEVVDRQSQPERPQVGEQRADPLGLAQRGGLGELHRQQRRVDARDPQPLPQLGREVRPVQLTRGHVERHQRLDPLPLPGDDLRGERLDHPGADRLEQAHLLGGGDEVVGHHQPAVGVLPAQQRLHRVHAPARGPHDRLVVQRQLSTLDRPPQPRGEREALQWLARHARVERPRRAAASLALVHRHVRVLEQLLGAVGVLREQRDPDARLHVELHAGDGEGLGQAVGELVGQPAAGRGRVLARDVARQQQELVAAVARQQRLVAADAAQARAHAPQQAVARGMAQRVVDELEVVEVDEQQRHRPPTPPGARDRGAQPRFELRAIRQAGDGVEERELAQLGLRAHALRDVLPGEHGDALPLGVTQARDLPGDLAP